MATGQVVGGIAAFLFQLSQETSSHLHEAVGALVEIFHKGVFVMPG